MENKRTKIIGLTGVIGSGKSTVADIFRQKGAAIIDADQLAREVVKVGEQGYNDIVCEFGKDILNSDSTLNRKELAKIIFSDDKKRLKLEAITHPLIHKLFYDTLEALIKDQNPALVVAVIPLLFESKNKYPELEEILVIKASKEDCLNRIAKRDAVSLKMAEKILKSQMTQEEKLSKADYIIDNTGNLKNLENEVNRYLENHG